LPVYLLHHLVLENRQEEFLTCLPELLPLLIYWWAVVLLVSYINTFVPLYNHGWIALFYWSSHIRLWSDKNRHWVRHPGMCNTKFHTLNITRAFDLGTISVVYP
jgi:hypothetical protein